VDLRCHDLAHDGPRRHRGARRESRRRPLSRDLRQLPPGEWRRRPPRVPTARRRPVVTGPDADAHIDIVLFGLSGRTIKGVAYAATMPAWGSQLSDEEIAAIINYERSAWGNSADTVTPEQVAAVRAAHKS
jgi:hypothetical protein